MHKPWHSFITNNIGYKILSVLVAIIIWYAIVYTNDPQETKEYTVPLEVINESYIANGKQVYHIDDEYKNIKVYITTNRSVLKTITEDDITVTADLTQIVDFDKDPIMVPLQVSCTKVSPEKITLSRTAIPIEIDNVATKEFPVTVDTGDSKVNKDYEIGSAVPEPEQIEITGPESIVSNIESVQAVINVTNLAESGRVKATMRIMNKDQSELSKSVIKDDLTFSTGSSKMWVYVELWEKRSGVTFDVNYSGSPEDGYQVSGIETNPEEITLAGTDDALKELTKNGNKIVIPAEDVPIHGAVGDRYITLNIPDYLPENTKLASNMTDTLMVTVKIVPNGTAQYDIDVDNITIKNLGKDKTVSYDTPKFTITISGDNASLEAFDPNLVTAVIDVKGLDEGDYELPVQISLPEGYHLVENVTLPVHIKTIVQETPVESAETEVG